MQKFWIGVPLLLVASFFIGRALLPWVMPEKTRSIVRAEKDDVTYICTESKQISKGPWRPTPALNPATGRATLVIAFYCPECKGWKPGPPSIPNRPPIQPRCPEHDIPLERDGPTQE